MQIHWLDSAGIKQCGTVPSCIVEFVQLIGWDATGRLLLELGGSEISMPRNTARPDSLLCQAIGEEAAVVVGAHFMGCKIRIPVGAKLLARHLRTKGHSVNEIARTIRRSDVTVRRYLQSDAPKGASKSRWRSRTSLKSASKH